MANGATLATFDAALKELYTNQRVENMVYKNNPWFALVEKDKNFLGREKPLPLIYGNPQGRSATFSRAQTKSLTEYSKISAFNLKRMKDYSIAVIQNELIYASGSDVGSFLKAATIEVDGAINSLSRSLAIAQYRDGSGAIGTIATTTVLSGTTITLANIDEITNFEIGQELVTATSPLSGAIATMGSSAKGLIVTGVNRATGVLAFVYAINDATNGIPTISATSNSTFGDYLFVRGDRTETDPAGAMIKPAGFQAWIPASTPAATAFFGVDRSVDPTRLAGQRFDGSTLPIEEALIGGASIIGREGGNPDHAFMNFSAYKNLENSLGAKVQYVDVKVNPEIGFRGIVINGPKSFIKCIPDMNCPPNLVAMLQLDTWKMQSMGDAVRVIDTDGLQMLRSGSDDAVEVRYGFYGNLSCEAPAWNCNIKLA